MENLRAKSPPQISRQPAACKTDFLMRELTELDHVFVDYDSLTYLASPQQSLQCPVCRNVLLDPVQTSCSHLLCARCAEKSFDEKLECPVDRTRMPGGIADCSPAPRWLYQIIDELEVVCPNQQCGRSFPRSSLTWHLRTECSLQPITCPSEACEEMTVRGECCDSKCEHAKIGCVHCEQQVMIKNMPSHLDECNELSHECRHCHAEYSAEDIRHHVCELEIKTCSARKYGCMFESARKVLILHEESCPISMMEPWLKKQEAHIANLGLENRSLRDAISRLEMAATIEPTIEVSSEYSNDRNYLFATLETLSHGLENLSASIATLDTKQSHVTMHESARTKDELALIRLGMQGLRMQWHHFVQNTRTSTNTASQARPTQQGDNGERRNTPVRQTSDGSRVKL